MNRRILTLSILFFVSLGALAQTTTWNGLAGPFGGTVNDLVKHTGGNYVAATQYGGIFYSTDGGATWLTSTGIPDLAIMDIEQDGTGNLYAVSSTRAFSSTDGGATWTTMATGQFGGATRIKKDINGTSITFWVSNSFTVYKSTNSGVSYSDAGFPVGGIMDIALNSQHDIFVATNNAGAQSIYYSNNGGTNWNNPTVTVPTATGMYSLVSTGSVVYALGSDGPYRLDDRGDTWTKIKGALTDANYFGIVRVDGSGGLYLFNASTQKIYSTANPAAAPPTWTAGISYPYPSQIIAAVPLSSSSYVVGFYGEGIYKTIDSGTTWTPANSGIKGFATKDVFLTPNGRLLVTDGNVGFYLSLDDGQTWTYKASYAGNTMRTINQFIKLADNSILGVGSGVIRSTDNGSTWVQQNVIGSLQQVVSADGTNLYAHNGSFVYTSSDLGVTWTNMNITGLPGGLINKITIDSGGNLYLKYGNGVYSVYKVPAASAAATKTSPSAVTNVLDIATVGTTVYALGSVSTQISIQKSTDGGATWTGKSVLQATQFFVIDDYNILMTPANKGVLLHSFDGGNTWKTEVLKEATAQLTDIVVSPLQFVYLGTNGSVLHKSSKVAVTPAPPTGLALTGGTFNQATMIFNDNSNNETYFSIWQSTGDNTHYDSLSYNTGGTMPQPMGWFGTGIFETLTPGTVYYWKVRAGNDAGPSLFSNEITYTTPAQCTSTSIPDNRSWTVTTVADPGSTPSGPGPFTNAAARITVLNGAPNAYTLSTYRADIQPGFPVLTVNFSENCGNAYFSSDNQANISNADGTWDAATHTLTFKWRATPDNPAFSATTTVVLNATDPVPATPTLLTYLYSSTEVLVNFSTTAFATSFKVFRSDTGAGGTYNLIATVPYPRNLFIDKNLTSGVTYNYKVSAVNATGESVQSANSSITTGATLFRPVENDINLNTENQQGVSWGDLDGDGDEDIASPSFTNSKGLTVPPVFYENIGGGQFTRRDLPSITNDGTVSRGIGIFDVNNDGKLDMYIVRSSTLPDILLTNNGSWNFTNTAITASTPPSTGTGFRGLGISDFDKDGFADIYVGNDNTLGSTPATTNQLLKNNAGTSFSAVTTGPLVTDPNNGRNISFADYDNDGDQDALVLNYSSDLTQPIHLYKNNGDGTFTKVTGSVFDADIFLQARTCSWGDIDNDGDLDLYVGSQSNGVNAIDRLYQNNGDGTFTSLTSSVVYEQNTITRGSTFGDIDNDGDLDLLAINAAANSVFINNGSGIFTKSTSPELLIGANILEIGVAMADFDNDGFLDVYPSKGGTSAVDLPNLLYKNTNTASASKNWVEVKLVGTASNRAALGARVTAVTPSPARTQIREVMALTGYGSQNSLIQHFGLGTATTVNITVKWPSGNVQTLANVAANQIVTITEDVAGPAPVTLTPANNATGVALATTLSITLDETPTIAAGKNITITPTLPAGSPQVLSVSSGVLVGKTITFTLPTALNYLTKYKVTLDAGAFKDIYNNASLPITTTWSFTSIDNTPPVFDGTTPVTFTTPFAKGFSASTFSSKVTDNVSIASVKLSYRGAGTTDAFIDLTGISAGGNVYQFTVLESMFNATGIDFHLTATDNDGNSTRYPVAGELQSLYETTSPVITFDAAQLATLPKNITDHTFSIVATDNFGVASVNMNYRDTKTGTTYTTVAGVLDLNVANKYDFVIPIAAFNGDGLEYTFDASDATGNKALSPAAGTYKTMLDNTAPSFAGFNAPPSWDTKFGTVTLSQTITDDLGTVSTATMHYRAVTSTSYSTVQGLLNGTKWDFQVLDTYPDENGLEYYFEATDPSGNVGRQPAGTATNATSIKYPSAKVPEGILGFGGKETDWKIFSVPFDLANNSVTTILADLGSTESNSKWKLLTYKDQTAWSTFPEFNTIIRGKGYFINIVNNLQVTVGTNLSAPANNRSNLFQVNLKKGWNQIGNPYLSEIIWSDVVAYNNLSGNVSTLKGFSSGSYVNITGLKPYEGGFVLADADVTISIPFKGQTAPGGRVAPVWSADLASDNWQLPLTLKQAGMETQLSGFGMSPDASVSRDGFDDFNPPRFFNYLEMFSEHPEHFTKRFAVDVVKTADNFTWNFVVASNLEGPAVLTWDNASLGDNNRALYLVDEATQQIVNMREVNHFEFNPAESSRLTFYYGVNAKDNIKPHGIQLGKATPNPTTGHTTVSFSLPESSHPYKVMVEAFDMMGRKVATLANGMYSAGFYTADWDVTPHPEGLYVYRLVAEGNNGREILNGKVIVKK